MRRTLQHGCSHEASASCEKVREREEEEIKKPLKESRGRRAGQRVYYCVLSEGWASICPNP
jgi:hypothetical protein